MSSDVVGELSSEETAAVGLSRNDKYTTWVQIIFSGGRGWIMWVDEMMTLSGATSALSPIAAALPDVSADPDYYQVWVIDDTDSACCEPTYGDTLTIIGSDGRLIKTISGLSHTQTIGGQKRLAVSADGEFVLVADKGDYNRGRLMR